jgi:hypothetical protein
MTLKIKTTYVGPTGFKGSKIKASFNGKTVSIPYDYSLSGAKLHYKAAMAFAEKHGLTLETLEESHCLSHDKGYFFLIKN